MVDHKWLIIAICVCFLGLTVVQISENWKAVELAKIEATNTGK